MSCYGTHVAALQIGCSLECLSEATGPRIAASKERTASSANLVVTVRLADMPADLEQIE